MTKLRPGSSADVGFLEEMLYEAFFWDAQLNRPPLAGFRDHPEFSKLLASWGRPGDRAIVTEEGESRIGAAWYRLWTPERHSYGFVDAGTPEMGMAVRQPWRSKGIGRQLLNALVQRARNEGFAGLSLSVSPQNYALRLYQSAGFRKVGESGTSWTLLLSLNPSPAVIAPPLQAEATSGPPDETRSHET
jgi:ribosomal-protein-alanine N-acetyltransferase